MISHIGEEIARELSRQDRGASLAGDGVHCPLQVREDVVWTATMVEDVECRRWQKEEGSMLGFQSTQHK